MSTKWIMLLIGCLTLTPAVNFAQDQPLDALREEMAHDATLRAIQTAWDANDVRRTRQLLQSLEPKEKNVDGPSFPWMYYNQRANALGDTIKSEYMWSRAFSPDNKYLFISRREHVEAWSLETLEKEKEYDADYPIQLVLSPNKKLLATASPGLVDDDKSVSIIDLESDRRIAEFQNASLVAFSSDSKLVALAMGDKVEVWTVDKSQMLAKGVGHTGLILRVGFVPDGTEVITAAGDSTLRFWSLKDGSQRVKIDQYLVDSWQFLKEPARIVIAARGRGLHMFDIQTGAELPFFQGPTEAGGGTVRTLLSPDQKHLAVAYAYAEQGTIDVWDMQTGKRSGSISLTSGEFDVCQLGQSSLVAVSDNQGGQISVWDIATLQKTATFPISQEHFSTLGMRLASSDDGSLLSYAAAKEISIFRLDSNGQAKSDPRARSKRNADSRPMVWIGRDGIETYDTSRQPSRGRVPVSGQSTCISSAVSANGQTVAALVSRDGRVVVWNDLSQPFMELQAELDRSYQYYAQDENRLVLSSNGRYLALVSPGIPLQLWDLESRQLIFKDSVAEKPFYWTIAVSSRGALAATQRTKDGMDLVLWTEDHNQRFRLAAKPQYLALAFSNAGQTLAAVGPDFIELWDTEARKLSRTYPLAQDKYFSTRTRAVSFWPDDLSLAITNIRGAERLEIATGEIARTFSTAYWLDDDWNLTPIPFKHPLKSAEMKFVAVSNDGKRVAAQSGDGHYFLWNSENAHGVAVAERAHASTGFGFSNSGERVIAGDARLVTSDWKNGWQSTALPESSIRPQLMSVSIPKRQLAVAWKLQRPGSKYQSPEERSIDSWIVQILDLETGNLLRQIDVALDVKTLALSPTKPIVAVGGHNEHTGDFQSHLAFYSTQTGELMGKGDGQALAFAADGQTLIGAVSVEHTLAMPAPGMMAAIHDKHIITHAVAPASNVPLIALAINDGPIEIWDYKHGLLRSKIHGHPRAVAALEFSPDGRYVYSGGTDKHVRAWNANTGIEVWSLPCSDPVWQLQFDTHGEQLLVRMSNNEVLELRGKP